MSINFIKKNKNMSIFNYIDKQYKLNKFIIIDLNKIELWEKNTTMIKDFYFFHHVNDSYYKVISIKIPRYLKKYKEKLNYLYNTYKCSHIFINIHNSLKYVSHPNNIIVNTANIQDNIDLTYVVHDLYDGQIIKTEFEFNNYIKHINNYLLTDCNCLECKLFKPVSRVYKYNKKVNYNINKIIKSLYKNSNNIKFINNQLYKVENLLSIDFKLIDDNPSLSSMIQLMLKLNNVQTMFIYCDYKNIIKIIENKHYEFLLNLSHEIIFITNYELYKKLKEI